MSTLVTTCFRPSKCIIVALHYFLESISTCGIYFYMIEMNTTASKQQAQAQSKRKQTVVDDLFTPTKEVPPSSVLGSPFVPPSSQVQSSSANTETLAAPTEDSTEESSKPSISKGMAIAICVGVIILAIVGLIIFLFTRPSEEESPKECKDGKQCALPLKQDPRVAEEAKIKAQNEMMAKIHTELEAYRKNDAIMKLKLNEYANKLQQMESENAQLRRASDPDTLLETFRQQQGMPTETGFIDVPDKPREGPKSEEEKTVKEKRQELMSMVNKPRKTVADMQQEEADLKEATTKQREIDSREIIDEETKVNILPVHNENENIDESLLTSIKSSGSLKQ